MSSTLFSLSLCLQEIHDARRIRNRILSNFELALQPGIDKEEAERLLHVIIVGGGPTGVEFGAELYDFIEQVSVTDTLHGWLKRREVREVNGPGRSGVNQILNDCDFLVLLL